jgi:hypothetical protein
VAAIPAAANQPLRVSVTPDLVSEPARVTVQVLVEPHAENRAIEIVAESEGFYRSSYVELEGDRAARYTVVRYRDLPAGTYEIRGVLRGSNGRERAVDRRRLTVLP